jgi:hypothetical protein
MMTVTYGGLNFDARPRTSAMTLLVGFVGFMYALSRLGTAIVLFGKLRSVRAKRTVAADRANPHSD